MSAFTPLLEENGHQRASCTIPIYEYTTWERARPGYFFSVLAT
jgi:hypothetical protein